QQQAYLATGTAAQLDQVAVRAGDVEDVVGRLGENLLLGAGDVVLRLLADLLEQLGPAPIIEELRRGPFRARGEPGEGFVAQRGVVWLLQLIVKVNCQRHVQSPLARRSPANCQRMAGWKKLR